jgi:hypothetical protein
MRHLRDSRRHGKREHGQILVLFELVMIMLLGFAAMVVDLGVLRNNRQILVNTLDAAALAGGSQLPVNGATAAGSANTLINNNIQVNYPGLPTSSTALGSRCVVGADPNISACGYQIAYKCLVGADAVTGKPLISRDVPGVCDPHNALHHNPPVDSDFTGAGSHLVSACDPMAGDKCNVVVITGSSTTQYALAPVLGVSSGSTGTVVSAACKGACGAATVVPVDLVIILDRTGSMKDGTNPSGAKIQALQAAAETVLGVYDPAKQRVGLALTGPGKVDASGNPGSGSCPSGGTALGVSDDGNFSPSTTLTTTGATNLFQGTFLSTTLGTAMTTTTPTTISVGTTTGFPTSGNFTIQIDSEQMQVKVASATTLTVVTRGYNSTTKATHLVNAIVGWAVNTTDTSIKVNDATGFPTTGSFPIQVDSEQMLVTAGAGTTTWTVTRGYNVAGGSTTKALHGGNEAVSRIYSTTDTSIRVNSASGFPTSGNYTILVDSEHMLVTGGQGTTTWTVSRHADSTTAATHTGGTAVTRVVGTADTTIQVKAPYGPGFPGVPFTIAVGTGGSNFEHMLVTATAGSSAPYTWTVTRAQPNGTAAATHNVGDTVDGVDPWVPSDATDGVWIPVGLSGTDTNAIRNLPSPTGADGTYSVGGTVQTTTPLVKSINCIQAASVGTNLTTPIQMAQWYLDNYGRLGVTQGIILETDGHPQVGFESGDQTTTNSAYTCQAALDAATAAKADTTNSPDGIQIFTIGYGVDSSSKCPTRTTNSADSNNNNNMYESSTWSNQPATALLSQMATDSSHYFDNPATSELAGVFAQAATMLAKGGAHLISLYPQPVVTGTAATSVSGMYFTGATSVTFGGAAATFSAASVTDTSIPITLPAGLTHGQTYPVVVTTPGGSSVITAASQYLYP